MFMVATPIPLPSNTTFDSLSGALAYADAVVGAGYLGLVLIILIWGTVFLASVGVGVEKRLLGATFFAFIASVILVASGLLAAYVTAGLLIAVFVLWILIKRYD